VDHVDRFGGPPLFEVAGERRHVLEQVVLGDRPGRSGRHVLHVVPAGRRDPVGEPLAVAPGEHRDDVARRGQLAGEGVDVDVLPSGVDAAHGTERAGVFGDEGDPHRAPPVTAGRSCAR
jgi:hypothetical protein